IKVRIHKPASYASYATDFSLSCIECHTTASTNPHHQQCLHAMCTDDVIRNANFIGLWPLKESDDVKFFRLRQKKRYVGIADERSVRCCMSFYTRQTKIRCVRCVRCGPVDAYLKNRSEYRLLLDSGVIIIKKVLYWLNDELTSSFSLKC
ncbi:hypothetical protein SFRURICE_003147, partial [Spodoptera frugiperda]